MKLPLSFKGIFLKTDRPKFLCEKLLHDTSNETGAQSAAGLLGEYSNMEKEAKDRAKRSDNHIDGVIDDMIEKRNRRDSTIDLFHKIDADKNGVINFEEFSNAYEKINPDVDMTQLKNMFEEADENSNGTIEMKEVRSKCFSTLMSTPISII